jgi:hypothetical protein
MEKSLERLARGRCVLPSSRIKAKQRKFLFPGVGSDFCNLKKMPRKKKERERLNDLKR